MNESVSRLRYAILPVLADRDRLCITVSWIVGCRACSVLAQMGFPTLRLPALHE